jgi:hypothetical protein
VSGLVPSQPTPLDPRTFFKGTWRGEGHITFHGPLSLFVPPLSFQYQGTTIWLSETTWQVRDRLVFTSGRVIEMQLLAEIVGQNRLHVTSSTMPGGADILLSADGFDFTPYLIQVKRWGIPLRLHCLDSNRLSPSGTITDTIKLYWLGLHVATTQIWITVERCGEKEGAGEVTVVPNGIAEDPCGWRARVARTRSSERD